MGKYLYKLFSWDGVTGFKIGVLIVVILIGTFIVFDVYQYLRQYDWIKKIGEACIYKCDGETCKAYSRQWRGGNYHDTLDKKLPPSGCMLTSWELSHFIFHIFIGYYYNLYISLLVGFGFEFYESQRCQCHSGFDLLYNTAGALVGNYFK